MLRQAAALHPGLKLKISIRDDDVLVMPGQVVSGRSPTLDRKGRLTLPGPLRRMLGLAPGVMLLLRIDPPGLRMVTPARLIGRLRSARLALAEALGAGRLPQRTPPR
jgi:bifunctional DNA-binding transcriptional regulator/antitoxin component of YhaV-PrlF toxin-antitoxin module